MSQKAPLFTIRPDPDQLRNLLPPDLVGLFIIMPLGTNGLMSPQAIYACWQKSPNSQFVEIVRLADSIAQHGQINPISVRVAKNNLPGVEYMIVTGELSLRAHVLLWTQGRNMEGDCLYLPPRTSQPIRLQGCFVSDEEIEQMVEHGKALIEAFGTYSDSRHDLAYCHELALVL